MVARLCIYGALAIALGAGPPAAGAANPPPPRSHVKRDKCERYRKRAEKRKCKAKEEAKRTHATPRPETLTTPSAETHTTPAQTISEAAISGVIFAAPSTEGLAAPPQLGEPPTTTSDPGTLTVTDANTGAIIETLKVPAGSSGFRVVVTAGTYVLAATDEAFPTASCAPDTITVTEGEQLSASIGCTEPSS